VPPEPDPDVAVFHALKRQPQVRLRAVVNDRLLRRMI
jgi:hypothetical protein